MNIIIISERCKRAIDRIDTAEVLGVLKTLVIPHPETACLFENSTAKTLFELTDICQSSQK